MKKFKKCFFAILMQFVEKCEEPLYKFLSILMEILYYFHIGFWKNLWGIVKKICNYRYTKEKYRYFSITSLYTRLLRAA